MAPKAKPAAAKKTAAKKAVSKKRSLAKKASPKKRRSPKAKKSGPKRPKNAYMFFANANRDDVMQKLKLTPKDIGPIGKALGKAWGKMTDVEKKPYADQAAKDLARYNKAKK